MCWNKRLVFVRFHLTASSLPSPLPLIEPFVSVCVFTITLFTENLWPQMVSASAAVSFLHRMPFPSMHLWFFSAVCLVIFFFSFAACKGEGRPRLQVPVLLVSPLCKCTFLLLFAPLASSHLFFVVRAEKINHHNLPWRETKEMKYKSNYDIAQLRSLRRTLSYVCLSL